MPNLHPMQPLEIHDGVARFRRNQIVLKILDAADTVTDLNDISINTQRGRYSVEDFIQLNELLGYSVSGFADIAASYDGDLDSEVAWREAVNRSEAATAALRGPAVPTEQTEADQPPGPDVVDREQLIRVRSLELAISAAERTIDIRDKSTPADQLAGQLLVAAAAFERFIVGGASS